MDGGGCLYGNGRRNTARQRCSFSSRLRQTKASALDRSAFVSLRYETLAEAIPKVCAPARQLLHTSAREHYTR